MNCICPQFTHTHLNFQHLKSMVDNSLMSRANTIVVRGGKMKLAKQPIFTPCIRRTLKQRKRSLDLL